MAIEKPKKPRGSDARDAAVKETPEFQNFERALKHVMNVPKADVDRMMAEGKVARKPRQAKPKATDS